MFAILRAGGHSGEVGVNRSTSRRPAASGPGGDLESHLDAPVRSLAEEGAVAWATADRLRSEADRAWKRALTATERRDALLAEKRRLVGARRALRPSSPDPALQAAGASDPADPAAGFEWAVAAMKADVFKALGHPARVRVLDVLSDGEQSVGRLAEALGMEISHLSHQLAVLRRAALVDGRREGSVVFYSLRQPQLSHLLGLIAGEMLWELTGTAD